MPGDRARIPGDPARIAWRSKFSEPHWDAALWWSTRSAQRKVLVLVLVLVLILGKLTKHAILNSCVILCLRRGFRAAAVAAVAAAAAAAVAAAVGAVAVAVALTGLAGLR